MSRASHMTFAQEAALDTLYIRYICSVDEMVIHFYVVIQVIHSRDNLRNGFVGQLTKHS